jgi:hypothetical protein
MYQFTLKNFKTKPPNGETMAKMSGLEAAESALGRVNG